MASETDHSLAGLIRNMAYAAVSAASAGLLLVLLIVAGRILGEQEYGKFGFALALGTIFETLMDFGLHQVTIRTVARDRDSAQRIFQNTLALKLIWVSATLVALVTTATLLRRQADVRLACYLIGGSLVLRSYMLTVRGVLQGLERFAWDSAVVVVDRLLLLVAGTAALMAGYGLDGLTIAFVVSRGVALGLTALLAHRQIGRIRLRFDRDMWRELQMTALPLGFFLVVLNLYSYVDAVMLGVMRSDAETGLYTAAYRLYEGLTYAPSIIAAVLMPRLSADFVTDRRRHRRLASLGLVASALLALPIGAVVYAVARPLMTLLFGAAFAASAAPLRILSVGLVFVFTIWVLHAIAISVNREKLLLKTGIVGLVVNVGVNLYLIPKLGMNGAALATIIGELVSMAMLLVGLRRTNQAGQAAVNA